MCQIRNYRIGDLNAVVSIFQRSVREVASRDYSPEQIAAWAPEHPDLAVWARRLASGGVFVCHCGEDMAGFARIDALGVIDLLFVAPDFQCRGVARALCEQAISWGSGRGVRRFTAEASITARPFFEHMGFRMVKSQDVERQGIRLNNFLMERTSEAGPLHPHDLP
jgi:putative acetyltransferase